MADTVPCPPGYPLSSSATPQRTAMAPGTPSLPFGFSRRYSSSRYRTTDRITMGMVYSVQSAYHARRFCVRRILLLLTKPDSGGYPGGQAVRSGVVIRVWCDVVVRSERRGGAVQWGEAER